jgi:hypothetical protein
MATDSTRVVCHLDHDPRLVTAVHAALHFQASHAGLEAGDCDELCKACEEVCLEALSQLADSGEGLEITIDTFSDRIEISIDHKGQLIPPVGLEIFAIPNSTARDSSGLNGMKLLERVDRVLFDSKEGVARTTLVKFLNPNTK